MMRMKKVMLDDIKDRYTRYILNFLTKSTIIDPRLRHLKFLLECGSREATESLKLDIELFQHTSESTMSLKPPSKSEHKLLEFI